MADDLKILITGSLNSTTSITEINKGIAQLQGKIDKLNLSIQIDNSVLNVLKDFSNQMSKIADIAKNTGKVIQESFNPDGSGTRSTYYNGLKGEFSQVEIAAKQTGDSVKKSTEEQIQAVTKLTQSYKDLAKATTAYNQQGQATKTSQTYQNGNNTLKVNQTAGGMNYTETLNPSKDLKDQEDLINQMEQFRLQSIQRVQQRERDWDTAQAQAINKNADLERQEIAKTEASRQAYQDWWVKALAQQSQLQAKLASADQQKVINQQDKLTQSLKKMYDQGVLNEQFFTNFNKAINSAQNLEELNKLQTGLDRVSQYSKNQNLQQSLLGQSQTLLGSGKNVDTAGINDLVTSLSRLNLSEEGATRQLSLLQAELRQFQSSATSVSETTSTFGDVLKNMSVYFGGFMLFTQAFSAIKSGISTIDSLNQALTQISIVTYQSQQQVAALGDQYNKLATQMGVTTSDITAEATELYRQGLTSDQVTERMKTITEYAKISSLDTKTASEIMTAAINGMGVSAQRAADVWSLLGDSTATGADEIGKSMQKVGSTAGELQIPFEKVSSWIAVISSKTRLSAESIGDSVKALLARMQSLKEKGFDETDGTQVNQVSKALAQVGIQLVDQQGNFRNFGTVMDELGKKWDTLTGRQKSYLATTVAGTYQQSNFLALMNGYTGSNGVLDLYAKAMDSAGTAEKKFQLYQQGTEAQLARLKDAWDALWMSAFKSNEIQGVIGSLTGLVNGIAAINNTFGTLPTLAGTATAAIFLFNSKVKESFSNLTASVATSIKEFGLLNSTLLTEEEMFALSSNGMGVLEKGMLNLSLAGRAAGVAFKALGVSIKEIAFSTLATALPVAAVMALTYGIEKLVEAYQQQKAEQDAIAKQGQDLANIYSKNASEIDKLASKYEELNSKSANDSTVKNSKEYVDTMNKLGKLMPSLVDSTNKHGDSVLKSSQYVKDELDYAKQLKDTYDHMSVDNLNKNIDEQTKSIDAIISKINDAKKNQIPATNGKFVTPLDQGTKDYWVAQQITNQHDLKVAIAGSSSMIQEQVKAYMSVQGITDKLTTSNQSLIDSYINQALASAKNIDSGDKFKQLLSDTISKAATYADELSKIPDKLRGAFSADQLDNLFKPQNKDQLKVIQDIGKAVKDGNTNWDSYSGALTKVKLNASLVSKIIDLLNGSTKGNTDATKTATDAQSKYADEMQKTIDAEMKKATAEEQILGTTQGLIDQSKDLITQYEMLSGMDNLSAEQKQLLADAIGKLSALYPNLIKNGKLNIDAIKQQAEADGILLKAVNDVKDGTASAQEEMTAKQMLETKDRIKAITDEITAEQALMDAIAARASVDDKITPQKLQEYDNASAKIDALKKQIEGLNSTYADQSTQLKSVQDATTKTNSATQNSIYVTDKYTQSLNSLNAQISNLQTLQKRYATDSAQYRSALSQEIALQQQKLKLMQDQEKSLSAQIKSGNIQQTGMINSTSTSSSPSNNSSTAASGGSTSAQIWNFFRSAGFSDSAISGIMGNLQQESSLSTTAYNSASGATGIAQWLGSRLTNLKSYAKSQGTSYTDLNTQLEFLLKELMPMVNSNGGINAINGMNSSQMASWFEANFERSGGSAVGSRQNYANQYYKQYAGKSGSPVSTSTASPSGADKQQAIDQAKSTLLQINSDIISTQQMIQQLQTEIVQSKIDEVVNTSESKMAVLNNTMKNAQSLQSRYTEGSDQWLYQMRRQIDVNDHLNQETATEIAGLQKLMRTEQLSAQQKADLTSKINDLKEAQVEYVTAMNDQYKQMRQADVTEDTNKIQSMYDAEIAKLQAKADAMDKVNQAQDRANQLADIQNQIDKAKSDKSHEYIDATGKVTYTYDKTQVADLEKQMSDQKAQWSKDDAKQAIQDQITALEKKRDDSIAAMQKLLDDYANKSFKNTTDLQNIMSKFIKDLSNIYNGAIQIPKHHDGGIVGSISNNGKLANFINNLFNVKPNEQIVKALKGEVMIPPQNFPNFFSNIKSLVSGISGNTTQVQPIVKTYNLNGVTIRANDVDELFEGIDNLIRSQG